MKKIFYMMMLPVLVSVTGGCKKESLKVFDQPVTGSSIYFDGAYKGYDYGKIFSFGFSTAAVKDTVLSFDVAVTGQATQTDREFVLKPAIATMVEGVNYDFVDPVLAIPAGKLNTKVKVKLYRTADLTVERKSVFFNLLPNENFNTQLAKRVTTARDTVNLLNYYIIADDIVAAPYAWSVDPTKTILINYLGAYSKVKLQLLIQLFNIDPTMFTDQKKATTTVFTVSLMSYWGSYMKLWLSREAAAGRIYKDENGVVITMGVRAS